jgi:hypothetical protein
MLRPSPSSLITRIFNSQTVGPLLVGFPHCLVSIFRAKCFPVTTAWRVLRLRMEERPPDMKGSCEYIE